MAEAVVSSLIEGLTSKIAEKLFEEVSAVAHFREDFEFLCGELVSIRSLLQAAGQKRNSRLISDWFEKVEDFLDDAADVVDDCEPAHKFDNIILIRELESFIFRCNMSGRIRSLKERLSNIKKSAEYLQYFISVVDANARVANSPEVWRERSTSRLCEEARDPVGMDNDIDAVTKLILQDAGDKVIGVVGMGGLGKTCLLQHVFNHQDVQKHFDHLFWLAISQSYQVKQLLIEVNEKIIDKMYDQNEGRKKEEKKELQSLSQPNLRDKIRTRLQGKKCLFVLDDVWKRSAYTELELPSEGQKKFLVSTREAHVAVDMGCNHPHRMEPLSSENSLKLFFMYVFRDRSDYKPSVDLESVAQRIVAKCGRLPLAVTAIAAYMATARPINEWEMIKHWELTLQRLYQAQARTIMDEVMPSLRLTYEALPDYLKSCFLYCCHFPKNTSMDCECLVYGWIAQGYVPTQEVSAEVYDEGLSYIHELIDRCLLEVSEVGDDGEISSCKMHDLLHDLAVSESKKQTKCLFKAGGDHEQEQEQKQLTIKECRGMRRISLMKNNISTIEEMSEHQGFRSGLRTLLLSDNEALESIPASFFKNLAYLTVLDLSNTGIKSLPETIGDLKHLKFLNLSCTYIEELPESLSCLRRLQFLDVSSCWGLQKLHSGIGEHKSMLHLNLTSSSIELLPVGISKLTNLRTLKGATFSSNENAANAEVLQLRDLKGLILLRRLSFQVSEGIQLKEGIFGGMTEMRSLSIYNDGEELRLPNDMKCMKRLEIVSLNGCEVPEWIFKLQTLIVLNLIDYTSADQHKGLANIPKLKTLELMNNGILDEFPEEFEEATAFPKLENLTIAGFQKLEKFPVLQDGTMPMLKSLDIIRCPLLKDIPEGLEKLDNLQNVHVRVGDHEQAEVILNGQSWQSLKNSQTKIKVALEWLDGDGDSYTWVTEKIGYRE